MTVSWSSTTSVWTLTHWLQCPQNLHAPSSGHTESSGPPAHHTITIKNQSCRLRSNVQITPSTRVVAILDFVIGRMEGFSESTVGSLRLWSGSGLLAPGGLMNPLANWKVATACKLPGISAWREARTQVFFSISFSSPCSAQSQKDWAFPCGRGLLYPECSLSLQLVAQLPILTSLRNTENSLLSMWQFP